MKKSRVTLKGHAAFHPYVKIHESASLEEYREAFGKSEGELMHWMQYNEQEEFISVSATIETKCLINNYCQTDEFPQLPVKLSISSSRVDEDHGIGDLFRYFDGRLSCGMFIDVPESVFKQMLMAENAAVSVDIDVLWNIEDDKPLESILNKSDHLGFELKVLAFTVLS